MLPKAKTVYFHVDVNSAFLSWTAIQHLANGETLDLRTVPAVVGGDEEKRHGVVLAKSIPAKRYGIQTGESLFMARSKYPNLIVAAPDFDWYVKNSKAMIRIFGDYTPDIEQYSIDEAFLNMTGSEGLFGPPLQAAQTIKDRIHRELGFTVNIGIAPNRLLAKMASDFEKPDKVHTLFPEEIPTKMWPLSVRDLLFLGKASEQKLLNQGIRTIGDLARERASNVQYWIGEKTGHQLWQYARGIDDSPVKAVPDEAKGFSVETTFNDDITSIEQVFPILLEQCDVLATRMRRKDKKCNCISVTFRTLDFRNRSHQTKLENATDLTDEIYINATRLFKEFWKGQPLRLIGVALTGLTDGTYEQMSLFEDTENKERHRKLDAAMDEIRMKFGNDKITRASIMNSNARIGRKAKAQMKNEKTEEP